MKLKLLFLFLLLFYINACSSYWKCEDSSCSNGNAKMTSRYCDSYEGEVKNGEPFGKGKLIYAGDICDKGYTRGIPKGTVYEGIWGPNQDGYFRLMGDGKISYPNGFSLSGKFNNDKIQNGPGNVTLNDNSIKNGIWKESYLCTSGNCENGNGTSIYVSADRNNILEGNFLQGYLNGKGKYKSMFTVYSEPIVSFWIEREGVFSRGSLEDGIITCQKKFEKYCLVKFRDEEIMYDFVKSKRNVKYLLK